MEMNKRIKDEILKLGLFMYCRDTHSPGYVRFVATSSVHQSEFTIYKFSDTYSLYRKDSLLKSQINLTLTEALKVTEEYYSTLPQINETYCMIYKNNNYRVEIKDPSNGYSDVTRHTDLDTIFGIIDDIAHLTITNIRLIYPQKYPTLSNADKRMGVLVGHIL